VTGLYHLELVTGEVDLTTWWKDGNQRVPANVWWLTGPGISRPATSIEVDLWQAARHGEVVSAPREHQAQVAREIGYGSIWLRRQGDHVLVSVEIGGKWYCVIREHCESWFSHCISPTGIQDVVKRGEVDVEFQEAPESRPVPGLEYLDELLKQRS